MFRKVFYKLHSGKNIKALYFARNYASLLLPMWLWRRQLGGILSGVASRADRDAIRQRVEYYCKSQAKAHEGDSLTTTCGLPKRQKVYFFDLRRYLRYFPKGSAVSFLPGDINYTPDVPSIVKSRPVCAGNDNGVLLKLNAIRHFIFVDDKLPFTAKMDKAVFRGKVSNKPLRIRFFKQFFGKSLCDLGDISPDAPEEWKTGKMTIGEHLHYKFILALEGNDVASNLKWVMSSNSIAVSTRPRYETWFMEGRLVGGVHYIEIADDFSDLEEKLLYYSTHADAAQAIIDNAHRWVEQFRDEDRERITNILVISKYLGYDIS